MLGRRKVLGHRRHHGHGQLRARQRERRSLGWTPTTAAATSRGTTSRTTSPKAVMYEISYNGSITDNTFVDNALGYGAQTEPRLPDWRRSTSPSPDPTAASQGRTETLQHHRTTSSTTTGAGVVLWENANRFCGPDSPDNAGSLVHPRRPVRCNSDDVRNARASTRTRCSLTAVGRPRT